MEKYQTQVSTMNCSFLLSIIVHSHARLGNIGYGLPGADAGYFQHGCTNFGHTYLCVFKFKLK